MFKTILLLIVVIVEACLPFEEVSTLESSVEPSMVGTVSTDEVSDGEIVFVSDRDGNNEIYKMNADGTQQIRLTNNMWSDDSPKWSPDGKYIVYVSYVDNNFEIFKMNPDGSQQTRLTNNLEFDGQPSWSPDGRSIVFVSNRDGNFEVYLMDSNGEGQRRLVAHPASESSPVWSPNGQYLIFSTTRNNIDGDIISSSIVQFNETNEEIEFLTDNQSANIEPAWSPDGERIAFVSDRDTLRGRELKIYLLEVNSRDVQRLTMEEIDGESISNQFYPSWSRTGKSLAFSMDDGDVQIYTINLENGQISKLTSGPGKNFAPHWQN